MAIYVAEGNEKSSVMPGLDAVSRAQQQRYVDWTQHMQQQSAQAGGRAGKVRGQARRRVETLSAALWQLPLAPRSEPAAAAAAGALRGKPLPCWCFPAASPPCTKTTTSSASSLVPGSHYNVMYMHTFLHAIALRTTARATPPPPVSKLRASHAGINSAARSCRPWAVHHTMP